MDDYMKYWVGSNMPGYLPDNPPFGTNDYALALSVLRGDLEIAYEDIDADGGEDAGDQMATIDGVFNEMDSTPHSENNKEYHVYVNGLHYYLETY